MAAELKMGLFRRWGTRPVLLGCGCWWWQWSLPSLSLGLWRPGSALSGVGNLIQSVLLFPSSSSLTRPWWFCLYQPPPQKEREGTLFPCPIGCLIYGMRTSSDSITRLSCLSYHLCYHLSEVFYVFSYMWFVQTHHCSLFESLEHHVTHVAVLSSVTKYFCVVTSFTIGGIPVLQKHWLFPLHFWLTLWRDRSMGRSCAGTSSAWAWLYSPDVAPGSRLDLWHGEPCVVECQLETCWESPLVTITQARGASLQTLI